MVELRALVMTVVVICAGALNPQFAGPVENITVVIGRQAEFTCRVLHLGGYRVGWVKADTKAIQAIHTHVITHNPRVHVSYDDHSTWHLLINDVTHEDAGPYMCQINTDPMISQMGHLRIITPPEILDSLTSSDTTVGEGGRAELRCGARGEPPPSLHWRREDGGSFRVEGKSVKMVDGPRLALGAVGRDHAGTYLCIAKNLVPPPVSKRVQLMVNFHPVISVANQLIGAPQDGDVTLRCHVEASPRPVTFWTDGNGNMLTTTQKYHVAQNQTGYTQHMSLVIRGFTARDGGEYRCVARNSMGEVTSTVTVYQMDPVTTPRGPAATPPASRHGPRRPTEPPASYGPIDAGDDVELVLREPAGGGDGPRDPFPPPGTEGSNLQIFAGFGGSAGRRCCGGGLWWLCLVHRLLFFAGWWW